MEDLFSSVKDLKIYKIQKSDVLKQTDMFLELKKLIKMHQYMYPDIEHWFKTKVESGIKDQERIAYIGLKGEIPVVSSILKIGEDSKFCHLHISEELRNQNLGDIFFSMMTLDVRNFAKNIHFTLPESLWAQKNNFFKSFGFKEIHKAGTQYRLFDEELSCSANFQEVFDAVRIKLPSMINEFGIDNELLSGLVMSIQPEFIDKILTKQKTVEVRRKFNTKWKGYKVTLYSTSPVKSIVGSVKIKDIDIGSPNEMWIKYGFNMGCSKEEYDIYTSSLSEVYILSLDEVVPYVTPVPLSQLNHLLDESISPPQSYFSISKNKDWKEAISLSEILHKRFNISSIQYV